MLCPICKTEIKFTWSELYPNTKMHMCFKCGYIIRDIEKYSQDMKTKIFEKQKQKEIEGLKRMNEIRNRSV